MAWSKKEKEKKRKENKKPTNQKKKKITQNKKYHPVTMCLLLNSVGKENTLHINYTPGAPDQCVSYVLHQLKEQKGKQWTEQVTQVSQMLRAEPKLQTGS